MKMCAVHTHSVTYHHENVADFEISYLTHLSWRTYSSPALPPRSGIITMSSHSVTVTLKHTHTHTNPSNEAAHTFQKNHTLDSLLGELTLNSEKNLHQLHLTYVYRTISFTARVSVKTFPAPDPPQ